jgi:SAM-dependent methyltransferase
MRALVGPQDPADYENPSGTSLFYWFDIPDGAYDAVFDFGCGCGRQARQLLLQQRRPRRYLGIDVRHDLIEWCRQHLTSVDAAFEFRHHDVYSPLYAPGNGLSLSQPFPAEDGAFSLVIASSVFTHLMKPQVEYYLSEIARILTPGGVAFTSWLFFDRAGFPFLPDVYSLHVDAIDFALAALFDREWFLETVRNLGLGVRQTVPAPIPGHQWNVLLVKRTAGMQDKFPLGADGADRLSGATAKAAAAGRPAIVPIAMRGEKPTPPPLPEHLAELQAVKRELDMLKRSRAWAIGRMVTSPARVLRKLF